MPRPRTQQKIAKARIFAKHRLQGKSVTDSWVDLAPKNKKIPREQAHSRATEFNNDPIVKRVVHEAFSEARVSQIDSHVEFHADIREWISEAKNDRNWTAVAALGRLRGSSGAYMSETFSISDERGTTEQLVARIAALSPALAQSIAAELHITVPNATEAGPVKAKSLN